MFEYFNYRYCITTLLYNVSLSTFVGINGIWSFSLSNRINKRLENQSTEGADFVWVSECQKGAGCEIINQFVIVPPMLSSVLIVVNWL
jgi:hypothetical protein